MVQTSYSIYIISSTLRKQLEVALLNIELEDGFNILDNQRSDDSHITDEKEKNEYNMGDFTRDEVDDELYGGDEDDDFIDDENFGNIFDSDEYDNQYEDQ